MAAYEQTAEERRLILDRTKRRAELRAEFLKQTSNPFKHGEGGAVVSMLSIGKHSPISPTFHDCCVMSSNDIFG